jgi:hypothetical protein
MKHQQARLAAAEKVCEAFDAVRNCSECSDIITGGSCFIPLCDAHDAYLAETRDGEAEG